MHYLFLILAFSLNALANILLKLGALKGVVYQGLSFGQMLSHNALMLFGLIAFALNAVFYFLALRNVPLSIAYPVMVVMSLLIINAYAVIALKEQVSTPQLIGYALVVTGIAFIFITKR